MKKILRTIIILLALGILSLGIARYVKNADHSNHMGNSFDLPMADYGPIPPFALLNQYNQSFGLEDLMGQAWVANFIFTRCTGPCPIMTAKMADLAKEFESHPELKFVSFSVDPEYDTPEILRAYANKYKAEKNRWTFLTGETDKIYSLVLEGFRLALQENRDPKVLPGEKVNHSLHFVLIDKTGHVRGYYNGYDKEALERLKSNLKTVLSS